MSDSTEQSLGIIQAVLPVLGHLKADTDQGKEQSSEGKNSERA